MKKKTMLGLFLALLLCILAIPLAGFASEPVQVSVTFMNGTTQYGIIQTINPGETATKPEKDPKGQWNGNEVRFLNWCTQDGKAWNFSTQVNEDLTLYACYDWKDPIFGYTVDKEGKKVYGLFTASDDCIGESNRLPLAYLPIEKDDTWSVDQPAKEGDLPVLHFKEGFEFPEGTDALYVLADVVIDFGDNAFDFSDINIRYMIPKEYEAETSLTLKGTNTISLRYCATANYGYKKCNLIIDGGLHINMENNISNICIEQSSAKLSVKDGSIKCIKAKDTKYPIYAGNLEDYLNNSTYTVKCSTKAEPSAADWTTENITVKNNMFYVGEEKALSAMIATNVAEVEGKYYPSVQEAIDAAVKDVTKAEDAKTVQLSSDVYLTESLNVAKDTYVNLDLNGHVLKALATDENKFSVITNAGTLTILDSDDDATHTQEGLTDIKGGIITGGKGKPTQSENVTLGGGVYNTGNLTLKGGTIMQCSALSGYGNGVYNDEDSTFIMNGGTITQCTGGEGDYVVDNRGTFNMNAGIICGSEELIGINNTSDAIVTMTGGSITTFAVGVFNFSNFTMSDGSITACSYGVENYNGTFTMSGGKIADGSGDNVSGVDNEGTFIMCGGEITNCSGNKICRGVSNNDIMKVSGSPKITGNKQGTGEDAVDMNVFLNQGKTITIEESGLESDAEIGITTSAKAPPKAGSPVAVTSEGYATDYSQYFKSDNASYDIYTKNENDKYQIMLGKADVEIDGEKFYGTIQEAIEGATSSLTLKLIDDVDQGDIDFKNKDIDITLELNGHSIKGQLLNVKDNDIKLTVASEADMNNAIRIAPASLHQTWNISKDITLNEMVRITDRYLTINGNDKTITGAEDTHENPNMTNQMFAIDSVSADSRNNVKINDLKFVGSERFKNVIAVQNKDENNNGIKLTLTDVSINHSKCRDGEDDGGAAILNFGSVINVRGKFNLTAGKNSCYAIGMDLALKNAELNFDDEATIKFIDNRTAAQKEARAMIFFSNRGTYEAKVSGEYVQEYLEAVTVGEEPSVEMLGYNLKAGKCHRVTALTEGEGQTLALGNKNAGIYDITKVNGGFTLANDQGYIAFDPDTKGITTVDAAYTWKYNGGLYTVVQEKETVHFLFWKFTKIVNVIYYVDYDEETPALITKRSAKVDAGIWEAAEHELTYTDNKDGATHHYLCKYCGIEGDDHHTFVERECEQCHAVDATEITVSDINVTITRKTSGWWIFKQTKYIVAVEPTGTAAPYNDVYTSLSNTTWKEGKTFTTSRYFNHFYVKVYEGDEASYSVWKYDVQKDDATLVEVHIEAPPQ